MTLAPGLLGAQEAHSAAALNTEGSQLIRQGKPAEALAKFETAAELTPEDPSIRYNIGLALFRLGRYRAALAPLELSLSHEATSDRVAQGLAIIKRLLDEPDDSSALVV